ncbi:hypothetical protein EMIT0P176_70220 [Pseudomonas sp. IT-P176]
MFRGFRSAVRVNEIRELAKFHTCEILSKHGYWYENWYGTSLADLSLSLVSIFAIRGFFNVNICSIELSGWVEAMSKLTKGNLQSESRRMEVILGGGLP